MSELTFWEGIKAIIAQDCYVHHRAEEIQKKSALESHLVSMYIHPWYIESNKT